MLQCHVKGCNADSYPLEIHDAQVDIVESEFNEEFIRKMIPRLDWDALAQTIQMVFFSDFISSWE
jgi:multifunctional methyltransferase subunit TRM112